MNIFEALKERKYTKEFEEGLDKATEVFLKQKNSIKNIQGTEGYKTIKEWFKMNQEASMSLIMSSIKDNQKAKGRYEVATEFLAFLDNLEKSE